MSDLEKRIDDADLIPIDTTDIDLAYEYCQKEPYPTAYCGFLAGRTIGLEESVKYRDALTTAVKYLKEGKQKYARFTTNSPVDEFISDWEGRLGILKEDPK